MVGMAKAGAKAVGVVREAVVEEVETEAMARVRVVVELAVVP